MKWRGVEKATAPYPFALFFFQRPQVFVITSTILSNQLRLHLSTPTMASRRTATLISRVDAAHALRQVEQLHAAREEEWIQYDGATTESEDNVETASPYVDEFMKKGGSEIILQMSRFPVEECASIFNSAKDDADLQWMSGRGKKTSPISKDIFF